MTDKSANFRARLDTDLHEQFLATCKRQDIPAFQVIRQLMRSYMEQHQSHSEATEQNKNQNTL